MSVDVLITTNNEDMTPAMSTPTPGNRVIATGFTVILLSVSAGMHFGGLLCFLGVLVGASFVAAGVRTADEPAPTVPVEVFDGAHALAPLVHRNTAAVGLVMASCAVTVFCDEADPVLCFATFALLLLGITLINIGARGE